MTLYIRLAMVSLFQAAACGGGGVEPELIPGGGVSDPGIDGDLHVHVIDEDSDQPLAGAEVWIGDELGGQTDSEGLFSADGQGGPQTITVTAAGYTSATWVGVAGANLTVPLSARDVDHGQGRVSGDIAGFEDLAVPAGRANIALVGYSANRDDDDPNNEIDQGDPAPNVCINAGDGATCEWTMRTRSGQMTVYAFLGTIDADMNIEVTGFAYQQEVVVEDGATTDGVELAIVDEADLVWPDVSLPSAPEGTDEVAAAVRLDLGDDGRMLVPVAGAIEVPVPDRALLDAASYELIGFAGTEQDGAESIRIDRDLSSIEEASVGTLLALPTSVSTDGTTYSFGAVAGASLHVASVDQGDDESDVWGLAILDGSTEVTLPSAVTLPDGELRFRVQAIELPDFEPADFSVDAIEDLVIRASGDTVTFSR